MTNTLTDAEFSEVVRLAPLVAIDLILRDPDSKILVGWRRNEPAKNTWFVPGGAIRKGETLAVAFERLLQHEAGIAGCLRDARLLGAYNHFYSTNRFGDPAYGTHYVTLGYELTFDRRPEISGDDQHSEFRWMSVTELLAAPDVHDNTKAYFRKS